MTMATTQIPLAELIEDMSVYPRHAIDGTNVTRLVQAMKAGVTLPPIVAERRTKRITDGWHRRRAYLHVLDATASVEVDLRTYKNDGELLLDAIRLNSPHGRQLDRVDQVRAVILAEQLGVSMPKVALAMSVPEERLEVLRFRVAVTPLATDGTVPGTLKVALKRPMAHFSGQTLTVEQAEAHKSQAGTPYLLQVHQLRDALKFDLLNRDDPRLLAALHDLEDVLRHYLLREAPAA